ncbi:hypothetical protein HOD82_04485 [bacterium]|nr:hypothetical protein [bacterium]MBT4597633.1 hypothetical protein [bacterium]
MEESASFIGLLRLVHFSVAKALECFGLLMLFFFCDLLMNHRDENASSW